MSKTSISRVRAGQARPAGSTDWSRVESMTDEDVLAAAMADPDAQPITDENGLTPVPNVRRLRERLGMTQQQFAAAFHLPVATVRDWEQRRRFPDAPARALLQAIDRDPETMRRLLSSAAE